MRENDAEDWPVRGDRESIDNGVDGVAQIFEARDEGHIQLASGQGTAERRGMVETHLTRPALNQRTSVEVLNAAETGSRAHLRRRPVRRVPESVIGRRSVR